MMNETTMLLHAASSFILAVATLWKVIHIGRRVKGIENGNGNHKEE